MQKRINMKKWVAILFAAVLMIAWLPSATMAEGLGANISASPGTADIGGTITVTVSASRAIPVTNYEIEISFDPALVAYTGYNDLTGASSLKGANASSNRVLAVVGDGSATTANLCQFTFRATAAGTAQFTITWAEILTETPPAGASTSVSIRTPLPGNTNLKSQIGRASCRERV